MYICVVSTLSCPSQSAITVQSTSVCKSSIVAVWRLSLAQDNHHSSLAGDCGISQPTAKAWLGILETSFVGFRLPPLRTNFRKRLEKMPKLHYCDTGLVCWLLGIRTPDQLQAHPLRGPIFETWVVSEIAKHRANRGEAGDISFFHDRNGAEADLVV